MFILNPVLLTPDYQNDQVCTEIKGSARNPEEFDDAYATSIEDLSHTFDIEVSLIQVLEPFDLISLYDCDKDIHYFFEVL